MCSASVSALRFRAFSIFSFTSIALTIGVTVTSLDTARSATPLQTSAGSWSSLAHFWAWIEPRESLMPVPKLGPRIFATNPPFDGSKVEGGRVEMWVHFIPVERSRNRAPGAAPHGIR